MSFNFKEEIRKNIIYYGKKITIYSNKNVYDGYCLFNKVVKNNELYSDATQPNEIGQVCCGIYSVWLVSFHKFKTIDYIVYNNTKYDTIFGKFKKETGCFEVFVAERS